jgi:L-threonylcarbamoyladenylate synthase
MGELIGTGTPELFRQAVRRAAELLRAGEVVALPTETVYGLAANALDAAAVARIFAIKGRPARNPVIVHVSSVPMARGCVASWPDLAEKLARAFWPGPLTLVLEKAESIPAAVTAGGETVGVRWPRHPLIQAVIEACGFPLAAPSANLSSQVSPTTAEHVRKQLGREVRLIVDGGQSQIGIESTVLDVTVRPPRLLRPGMIHAEGLMAVTGGLALPGGPGGGALKSPGLLRRHYSPRAKLVVWEWENEGELRVRSAEWGGGESEVQSPKSKVTTQRAEGTGFEGQASRVHVIAHTKIPGGEGFGGVSVIPRDAEAFARAIYAELHRCDEAGAQLIVVEALPEGPDWRAIADRLRRAAAED